MNKELFWLHIKKSAGQTVRQLLQPHYRLVDCTKKPKNFIQSTPAEYNDILNNHRVVLGDLQFKRCLFAKEFLYPDRWSQLYSFCLCREPVDRVISMFYYLFWKKNSLRSNLALSLKRSYASKRLILRESYAFDVFLDTIVDAKFSDSIYKPLGLHFSTHVNSVWDDITDHDGRVLITATYRMEELKTALNSVFEECGIVSRISDSRAINNNQNTNKGGLKLRKDQKLKVRELYLEDFELYENALR